MGSRSFANHPTYQRHLAPGVSLLVFSDSAKLEEHIFCQRASFANDKARLSPYAAAPQPRSLMVMGPHSKLLEQDSQHDLTLTYGVKYTPVLLYLSPREHSSEDSLVRSRTSAQAIATCVVIISTRN